MRTRLNRKGQITLPKQLRDAMGLSQGARIDLFINADGLVLLRPAAPATAAERTDRLEALPGAAAAMRWTTDDLMRLLRGPAGGGCRVQS